MALRLAIVGNETNPISLSPDGTQVAYTERAAFSELWVVEGFVRSIAHGPVKILPLSKPSK